MESLPSTHLVIVQPKQQWNNERATAQFPRLMHQLGHGTMAPVVHPDQTTSPAAWGTSGLALLYALGHDHTLEPLVTFSPQHVRQLRDIAYGLRQSGGKLHVFGLLDNDSPYGSRRLLEPLIRYCAMAQLPTVVHLGVWQPLPRDFSLGLREMESVCHGAVQLGSLFAIEPLLHASRPQAKKYIDGIFGLADNAHREPTLPLHQPYHIADTTFEPEDALLIANHSLHGLPGLEDALHDGYGQPQTLWQQHPVNPAVSHLLQQKQHVMALTNSQPSLEAYVGSDVHDPYFEVWQGDSAEDLLGMALSPSFGYHVSPALTLLILAEPPSATDKLVSDYIKHCQQQQNRYVCYILDPQHITGSVYATNTPHAAAWPVSWH